MSVTFLLYLFIGVLYSKTRRPINVAYFCDFSCGVSHTVCRRAPCPAARACGSFFRLPNMDDQARELMVTLHNNVRNKVALSEHLKTAADMSTMSYSKELEFVAQCWANACPKESQPHDECREIKNHHHVGQNVYISDFVSKNHTNNMLLELAFQYWESSLNLVTPALISSYQDSDEYAGITQVIWGSTHLVGCGRARFGTGLNRKFIVVCNYASGGNIAGKPIYTAGPPCSKCNQTSSSKWKALCGERINFRQDTWEPPFEITELGNGATKNNFFSVLTFLILTFTCITSNII